MAKKDSTKAMGKGEGAENYRPAYIVRFVEASTGEELYGEPLDYAPGQEITSAQARRERLGELQGRTKRCFSGCVNGMFRLVSL